MYFLNNIRNSTKSTVLDNEGFVKLVGDTRITDQLFWFRLLLLQAEKGFYHFFCDLTLAFSYENNQFGQIVCR